MKRIFKFTVFILALISISSCISNKKLIYLQNLNGNTEIPDNEIITYEIPEYRLQFNDIVDVKIQTIDDLIENGFDFTLRGQMQMGGVMGAGDIYYLTGFPLDKNGNITLPIVGEVNVVGKTIEEAKLEIEKSLKNFITSEIYVRVKLGGIRFSTLGEFRGPGKFVVLQERVTIFEAIAQAGDLTPLANRDELMIIRQYPEGSKIHRINLNDRQLINSPFYFIQPNDQLYAEPMKAREFGTGQNFAQNFSLLMTLITSGLLIYNIFIQ